MPELESPPRVATQKPEALLARHGEASQLPRADACAMFVEHEHAHVVEHEHEHACAIGGDKNNVL